MSLKYMSAVWEHSKHWGTALVTMLALADEADHRGRSFLPNTANLARKARAECDVVERVIDHLCESGELILTQNGYVINLPDEKRNG